MMYVVSAVVGGLGVVLLSIGYAREHHDLQRLYILGVGWLTVLGSALLVLAAIVFRSRRRQGQS